MPQLAGLIRSKYPGQYDDLSDEELESKVTDKYPEYKDLTVPQTEEPGLLSKITDFATKPLLTFPSTLASEEANRIDQPSLTRSPGMARLQGFGAGALQGLGDLVSSLSSPVNLATGLLSGGSGIAEKQGFDGLASGLNTGARILGTPVALQGAKTSLDSSKPLSERALGLTELAGGVAQMLHSPSISKVEKPIETPVKFQLPEKINIPIDEKVLPKETKLPEGTIRIAEPTPQKVAFLKGEGFNLVGKDEDGALLFNKDRKGFEDIQFASHGTQGLKIGADIESLGKTLGSSLYQGDIAKIATKELVQNSLDAVRDLGDKGEVKVTLLGGSENTLPAVEVKDNGPGLTLQQLQTVFSDLGSSGKRSDESAIGGFGIAKAAPLLGGKKVEVSSITKEGNDFFKHSFEGTPDELLKGINISSEKLPPSLVPYSTGLQVRTYIPKDSNFYSTRQFVKNLVANSNFSGKLEFNRDGLFGPVKENLDKLDLNDPEITKLSNPASDVEIIIPKNSPRANRTGVNYQILNNGMYQASGQHLWQEIPDVPKDVLVNIKSKVPEGHSDYPFTVNREKLRGSTQEQVEKYLTDVIVNPSIGKRANDLKTIYEGIPQIPIKSNFKNTTFHVYDSGNKFTPDELNQVISNPKMQGIASEISNTISQSLINMGNPGWISKLKKIGFLFAEPENSKIMGVHIPNPGAENPSSFIGINPFSIMERMKDPEGASTSIVHTIYHELAHVAGGGHDADFAERLANFYEKVGSRKTYEFEKKFEVLYGDKTNSGNYDSEIQNLLSRYQESRRRPEVTKDILFGTGIKSEVAESGENPIPRDVRPPTQRAITELQNSLKEALPLRTEQEDIYSETRSERLGKALGVKAGGESGFYKKLAKLKGKMEQVPFQGVRSNLKQGDVTQLFNHIMNSQDLRGYEKFRAGLGLAKLLDGGKVPQLNEITLLGKVFGSDVSNDIQNLYAGFGGIGTPKLTSEFLNVPKSLRASIDLSAPFRQGAGMVLNRQFYSAFKDMFKYAWSEDMYKGLQDDLVNRPFHELGEKAGLKLTNLGDLDEREEQYMSNWAESGEFLSKLPGAQSAYASTIGRGVRASDRAYTGFLNKLRADTFDSLIKDAKNAGETPYLVNRNGDVIPTQVGKDIAKVVNNGTGRGDLGRFEKYAVDLNNVFFSPRFVKSRIQMLNPNYYINLSPISRKQALKSLFAIASLGLTTTGIGLTAGGKTSLVPTSPDFGKLIGSNTRIDAYGGLQQYIVAAMKLIKGESTSSISGKTTPFGSSPLAQTRLSTIMDAARNRLSPIGTFITDLLAGSTSVGDPIKTKSQIAGDAAKQFVPMVLEDLYSLAKDDPKMLPTELLSILGVGVQAYDKPTNKGELKEIKPTGELKPLNP